MGSSSYPEIQGVYANTITTGQSAPTTAATSIAAARPTRKRIVLVNQGTVDVYVGNSSITTTNGLLLPVGASVTLYTTAQIYGRTNSGTAAVHYIEEYDS